MNMNKHKGFSLPEAMVGLVILAVAVAGALSFFIFQSRSGFVSSRLKTADQELSFIRTMLMRDLCQSGFGVATHPELALYVVDGGSNPDQLYVNYPGHLTMEEASQIKDATLMKALKQNSVYYETGAEYQGFKTVTSAADRVILSAIPKIGVTTIFPDIGAFITKTAAGAVSASEVKIKATTAVDGSIVAGTQKVTQDWTFPISPSITATATAPTYAAPAISYKLIREKVGGTGEIIGGLWRNRGLEAEPYGSPVFGGTPFLEVTNFLVRIQLNDATWVTTIASGTASTIRLVEITISYRTRGKGNIWSSVQTSVITAVPRTVAFQS